MAIKDSMKKGVDYVKNDLTKAGVIAPKTSEESHPNPASQAPSTGSGAAPPGQSHGSQTQQERAVKNKSHVRLQADEQILLQFRRTAWGNQIFRKVFTLGLYVPWWRAACYVVTDQRLITKKGILNKTDVSLPLKYVQDASVHRAWYDVARVDISTAGGNEGLSRMGDLKPKHARQLADTIMAHAKRSAEPSSRTGIEDVTETLSRLAQLRDSGALTDEEFAQQKARVLRPGS